MAQLMTRLKQTVLIGVAFGVSNGFIFCTYALLFWYGSTLISSGKTTFTDMMKALFCIMFGKCRKNQMIHVTRYVNWTIHHVCQEQWGWEQLLPMPAIKTKVITCDE